MMSDFFNGIQDQNCTENEKYRKISISKMPKFLKNQCKIIKNSAITSEFQTIFFFQKFLEIDFWKKKPIQNADKTGLFIFFLGEKQVRCLLPLRIIHLHQAWVQQFLF